MEVDTVIIRNMVVGMDTALLVDTDILMEAMDMEVTVDTNLEDMVVTAVSNLEAMAVTVATNTE